MNFPKYLISAAILTALCNAIAIAPAAAQTWVAAPYTTWQEGWNRNVYDRHHVILGVVSDFHPYRLTLTRRNGDTQTVDLKNGTKIFPTGATPTPGEHVALVGYYSNGTFIVNRLVVRP